MGVDRLASLIMKGGFKKGDVDDLFGKEGMKNVDGSETSFDHFAYDLVCDRIVFGAANIFTDSRTIEAETRAAEMKENSRPYWKQIRPLDLPDWQVGPEGGYEAFRYEYKQLQPRKSLREEPQLFHFTTLAQMQEIGVMNENGEETGESNVTYVIQTYVSVDEELERINYHPECSEKANEHEAWIPHGEPIIIDELDHVPIASTRIKESWIKRAVPVALKIYNKQSGHDNIEHSGSYDKISIAGDIDTFVGQDGSPLDDNAKRIVWTADNIIFLPQDSIVNKLEPTDLTGFRESIAQDIVDLFRVLFNMMRTMPTDSRASESAETKEEVKEDLITRLESLRKEIVDVLNVGIRDWYLFTNKNGNPEDAPQIAFAEPLTKTDIDEIVKFVNMIQDRIVRSDRWYQETNKLLLEHFRKLGFTEDVIQEISQELDTISAPDEQMLEVSGNRRDSLRNLGRNPNARTRPSQGSQVPTRTSSNRTQS